MYIYIYTHIFLSLSLSIYIYIYVSIYIYIYIYIYVHIYLYKQRGSTVWPTVRPRRHAGRSQVRGSRIELVPPSPPTPPSLRPRPLLRAGPVASPRANGDFERSCEARWRAVDIGSGTPRATAAGPARVAANSPPSPIPVNQTPGFPRSKGRPWEFRSRAKVHPCSSL